MADERIRMPSGMGGLVKYDDTKSKLQIPTVFFVAFVVVVILFYLWINLS